MTLEDKTIKKAQKKEGYLRRLPSVFIHNNAQTMKFGTGTKIVQVEHKPKFYLRIVETQPIL